VRNDFHGPSQLPALITASQVAEHVKCGIRSCHETFFKDIIDVGGGKKEILTRIHTRKTIQKVHLLASQR